MQAQASCMWACNALQPQSVSASYQTHQKHPKALCHCNCISPGTSRRVQPHPFVCLDMFVNQALQRELLTVQVQSSGNWHLSRSGCVCLSLFLFTHEDDDGLGGHHEITSQVESSCYIFYRGRLTWPPNSSDKEPPANHGLDNQETYGNLWKLLLCACCFRA